MEDKYWNAEQRVKDPGCYKAEPTLPGDEQSKSQRQYGREETSDGVGIGKKRESKSQGEDIVPGPPRLLLRVPDSVKEQANQGGIKSDFKDQAATFEQPGSE